jgi:hypothetical protein
VRLKNNSLRTSPIVKKIVGKSMSFRSG